VDAHQMAVPIQEMDLKIAFGQRIVIVVDGEKIIMVNII
jgi:hypothetical protein